MKQFIINTEHYVVALTFFMNDITLVGNMLIVSGCRDEPLREG